ncbi:hypothetical protein CHISP_2640 [Chitinispirillum alkaliphilum]|nr:hypothetical protein CHISP_2640 [Chitinispirillum alkaliphilum]
MVIVPFQYQRAAGADTPDLNTTKIDFLYLFTISNSNLSDSVTATIINIILRM